MTKRRQTAYDRLADARIAKFEDDPEYWRLKVRVQFEGEPALADFEKYLGARLRTGADPLAGF